MRAYFHLPYRQTGGIIKAIGGGMPNHPCYEQMFKRINKWDTDGSDNKIVESEDTVISIDGAGIQVTNRGQRLIDNWLVKERKGHPKIHAAVDTKTKEIFR